MAKGSIFVDTSIQVARFVHSPETKERIESRLRKYDQVVTGLVVRQEFKRRLLKEAKYLLGQLDRQETVTRLRRHVQENLPQQQARKQSICLAIIQTVDERDTDEDQADRLRFFLRALLREGLDDFDSMVSLLLRDSGCACALQPIRRAGSNGERYEFGTDRCSKVGDACKVVAFLSGLGEPIRAILDRLERLDAGEKTAELKAIEQFLHRVLDDATAAQRDDPCLTVGDLLVALESTPISSFYTLNRRESKHLCPALGQELIVRPKNAVHEDDVIPAGRADEN